MSDDEDDNIDIYEDLEAVYEEKEKEKGLIEKVNKDLETKYNNALESISKLEEENKDLKKKLKIIKINFKSLMETVRIEISRKDTLIDTLRKEKDDICFRRKLPTRSYSDESQFDSKHVNKEETNIMNVLEKPKFPTTSKIGKPEEKNSVDIPQQSAVEKAGTFSKKDNKDSRESQVEQNNSTEKNNNKAESFFQFKPKPTETYSKRSSNNEDNSQKASVVKTNSNVKNNDNKGENFSESRHKSDTGSTVSKYRDRQYKHNNKRTLSDEDDKITRHAEKRKYENYSSCKRSRDYNHDEPYDSRSYRHRYDDNNYNEDSRGDREKIVDYDTRRRKISDENLGEQELFLKINNSHIKEIKVEKKDQPEISLKMQQYDINKIKTENQPEFNFKMDDNNMRKIKTEVVDQHEFFFQMKDDDIQKIKEENLDQQELHSEMHGNDIDCAQVKIKRKKKRKRKKRNKNRQNEKCAENCVKDTQPNLKTTNKKRNKRKKKKMASQRMEVKQWDDENPIQMINSHPDEKLFKSPKLIQTNCDMQLKQSNLNQLLNEYRPSIFETCIKTELQANKISNNGGIFAEETDDEHLYKKSSTDSEEIVIDETDEEEQFTIPIPVKSFYPKVKKENGWGEKKNLAFSDLGLQPKLKFQVKNENLIDSAKKNVNSTNIVDKNNSYMNTDNTNKSPSYWAESETPRPAPIKTILKNLKVPIISSKKIAKKENSKIKKQKNHSLNAGKLVDLRVQCLEAIIDFHKNHKIDSKNFNVQLHYKEYLNLYIKLKEAENSNGSKYSDGNKNNFQKLCENLKGYMISFLNKMRENSSDLIY